MPSLLVQRAPATKFRAERQHRSVTAVRTATRSVGSETTSKVVAQIVGVRTQLGQPVMLARQVQTPLDQPLVTKDRWTITETHS